MANEAKQWQMRGLGYEFCNCDYGCGCNFGGFPNSKDGSCRALVGMHIQAGKAGTVDLSGVKCAAVIVWPKAIHEGNGTLAVFIDERATPQQREALLTICSGKAGGLPFEILAVTITKVLDPIFAPIEFNLNGRDSSVYIGKSLQVAMEPIKNPVTKEPESVRVDHGTGFIFKTAEAVSAKECRVDIPGLNFAWPDKAGFVTRVSYSN